MKNEFGVTLDRNGYAPSLIEWREGECLVCGRKDRPLQRHEVFHGPFRERSKNLGCWVSICDVCHDKLHHKENMLDRRLKYIMQKRAMKHYGWSIEDFRRYFGKNHLEFDNEQVPCEEDLSER